MMTTAQRAQAIEQAGGQDASALLDLVAAELGHAEALDRFVAHGDIHTRAEAAGTIVHIVAGNTPEAAMQTVTRGLLVGAHNQVKVPAAGITEFSEFVDALPAEMASLVEITEDRETAHAWIGEAAIVIVFGSDETLWEIGNLVSPSQTFIAHGHKISIVVIDADPDGDAATVTAGIVAAHDQRGCLSPHDVYVADSLKPRMFAETLANALANCPTPEERSFDDNAAIDHLRRSYQFRASSDTSVQTWQSEGNADWTVVFEEEPQFAASPLGRFVFVKPLPADLSSALAMQREHLSTIALHPFDLERASALSELGATRICPLANAQSPSPFWHPDGEQALAPLVRWVDAG